MDRRTSVFIPCSLAISNILSSCFSTGFTSSKGLPCHPAPTSHHLPLVSDCRRSLSVTRSGSFVRTADQFLPAGGMLVTYVDVSFPEKRGNDWALSLLISKR